jgi:hypothetical protein
MKFLLPSDAWIIFKDDVGKMEIRTTFWSENQTGSDGMEEKYYVYLRELMNLNCKWTGSG